MQDESSKNIGQPYLNGMTCEHFRQKKEVGPSISSAADSPANQSHLPEDNEVLRTKDGCGQSSHEFFAIYDQGSRCWRTSQGCLFEELMRFSDRWPKSGSMRNGKLFRRPRLVPISLAKEYLSLPVMPRPVACDGKGTGRQQNKMLRRRHGGAFNLRDFFSWYYKLLYPPVILVEYLMGFPIGWTDLDA